MSQASQLVRSLLSLAALLATGCAQFAPRVPEQCFRTGICEDIHDYPYDHVTAIIANLGNAMNKYKTNNPPTCPVSEILERSGSGDMELCDFSQRYLAPMAAPDKDDKWHYILNQKDKPLQGYFVDICNNPDSPCSNLAHVYTGYESVCKQRFILRRMAGLNERGEMVQKEFNLPSCCSCVVRQINSLY